MNQLTHDEQRKLMIAKGYRYLLSSVDKSIEPLYVKTISDCAWVLKQYPHTHFSILRIV